MHCFCDAVAAVASLVSYRPLARRLGLLPAGPCSPLDECLSPACSARAPERNRRPLLSLGCPTQIKRPDFSPVDAIDARTHSTEAAPASAFDRQRKRAPTMSLQRPLHSPPKAEHNLFVPDKEQNPSPPRETQSQKPKAIPGYRGFIRGSQHYYGLTDGEVSRRAPSHNFVPTSA